MFDGLEDLRHRADAGDGRACIELGDRLLARAPYDAPRWEADARWSELRQCEHHADLRATEAFDYQAHARFLYNVSIQTRSRLLLRLREEDLGRDTPSRAPFLQAAAHYLDWASRAGDPAAAWRLGWRCWLGQGVPADTEMALHWWRQAAELGDCSARCFLRALGFLPDPYAGTWDPDPVLSRSEPDAPWPQLADPPTPNRRARRG